MRITHVSIDHFRCFKHLELDVDKCHALIGENGVGKTAVLEAINLATSKSSPSARIDEQDFNSEDEDNLCIQVMFSDPFLLSVEDGYVSQDLPCDRVVLKAHRRDKQTPGSLFSGQFVAAQYAVPLIYEAGKTPILPTDVKGNIPVSVQKTDEGYSVTRKNGKEMDVSQRHLSLQNDLIGYPNIFYFDRDREKEARVGFGSLLTKIVKDLNWRFRKSWDQQAVVDAWDRFYQTVIATVMDPKGGRIMAPLRQKLEAFAGRDFANLELSLLDIEQPFAKAFFSRRTASNQIEQKNLGSGISILLSYFLIELVSRNSKEKFMFLIDEPELHLHPQLQQQLLEEFRATDFQILYTTQSDCFVDISEWRSITKFSSQFSVDPTEDVLKTAFLGKAVAEHLDEIKTFHQQKSIFFREDNQIFFSRRALLVEGPAEKYGLPILAAKLGLDLGNVTITSCNGKNKIPYYQLLCKAFGIPYFTLLDLDGGAETDTQNGRVLSGASDHATFTTSLEALLGVTPNAEHKASIVLTKIDEIAVADIPAEVGKALNAIVTWSNQ